MLTFESQGQEINRRHLLAHAAANDAIEHAKAAGVLLLEIKSRLKHGQFLHWVSDNAQMSLRQAQRYMAVAQGKTIPLRRLIEKNDTVSHLEKVDGLSEGVWIGGKWQPEPGYVYLFKDETGTYWVTPSAERAESFHVCKHYNGDRMSSEGYYWRYTIFSVVNDPDLTSNCYMGTRFPLFGRSGVSGVLKSYGLSNLKETLQSGNKLDGGSDRPFGEPPASNWYWNSETPDDGLFNVLVGQGYLNSNGAITYLR
jgi:hypothetical protein